MTKYLETHIISKIVSISSSKDIPGPATYEPIGMNRTGSYFLSKYSGSKASVFSPPTSTRFGYVTKSRKTFIGFKRDSNSILIYLDKYIPGPGAYNCEAFTNEGRYYNSKLRSAAGGKFSLGARKTYVSKDALLSKNITFYFIL